MFVMVRQEAALVAAVFVLLISLGLVGGLIIVAGADPPVAVWHGAPVPAVFSASPTPATTAVTLAATGDIIMGDAPDRLPPEGGRGMFDAVEPLLAADLVMGNLEEPLTDENGYVKCKPGVKGCNQFRVPPEYAAHVRDAGFDVLNLANNHSYDYGAGGYRSTQRALERYGLAYTGGPNQVTVAEFDGVRVGVLGFSPYAYSNSLLNIAAAKAAVARAASQVDLVVVQAHMGAEGPDRSHVRRGTEMFLGENRGDPIRFSHAVIDAGADLVVGHGPHVMRALEFYKGRLIAYSLGNFAGGAGTLRADGNLGLGAVLKVSLRRDGTWAGGEFISTTHQGGGGLPRLDSGKRGLAAVQSLSRRDFPTTGPRFEASGAFNPPQA